MPDRRGTTIEPQELEQANPFPAGRFAEAETQEQRGPEGSRDRGAVPTRSHSSRPDTSTNGPVYWTGVHPLPPIDPSMPVLKPGDQAG